MEGDQDYRNVVSKLQELEERLLRFNESNITNVNFFLSFNALSQLIHSKKVQAEAHKDIESHFESCINVLISRKKQLLAEVDELIQQQSM